MILQTQFVSANVFHKYTRIFSVKFLPFEKKGKASYIVHIVFLFFFYWNNLIFFLYNRAYCTCDNALVYMYLFDTYLIILHNFYLKRLNRSWCKNLHACNFIRCKFYHVQGLSQLEICLFNFKIRWSEDAVFRENKWSENRLSKKYFIDSVFSIFSVE